MFFVQNKITHNKTCFVCFWELKIGLKNSNQTCFIFSFSFSNPCFIDLSLHDLVSILYDSEESRETMFKRRNRGRNVEENSAHSGYISGGIDAPSSMGWACRGVGYRSCNHILMYTSWRRQRKSEFFLTVLLKIDRLLDGDIIIGYILNLYSFTIFHIFPFTIYVSVVYSS